jgi:hypothetical protein
MKRRYTRFHEMVFSLVLDMELVRDALHANGWKAVCVTRFQNLHTTLEDPEKEPRVFFVVKNNSLL